MATITRDNFVAAGTQIASTATAYVTAATGETVAIDKVLLFNTTAGVIVVNFYVEASGATPAAADEIHRVSVPATESVDVTELANLTLDAGQALFAVAGSATSVNLYAAGRRIA